MPNKNKAKGSNVERELIAMFWDNDWGAVRVAGSGSARYPNPDVLASNGLRRIAVECKFISEDKKYFQDSDLEQLTQFSFKFGAEPWIGIKFSRKDWYFIKPIDLEKSGTMFLASIELCQQKGLSFDKLIKVV
jgi:Holliday junction resolvase